MKTLTRWDLQEMGVESVTVHADRTSRGFASVKTVRVGDVRRLVMRGAESGVLHYANRKRQQDWKLVGRVTLNMLPYKQEPSQMLRFKPGQVVTGKELESEHVLRVEVGFSSLDWAKHPGGLEWFAIPIREVVQVRLSESSSPGHATVERRPGLSPQFVAGQLRLYRHGDVRVDFDFGDPPAAEPESVGAAVLAAAAELSLRRELPVVPAAREKLVALGVTHVDLTPHRWDGTLGTTRSIEVEKVSEALAGPRGYVTLRDSTAQLHGDVRFKVPRAEPLPSTRPRPAVPESVPGGFASQVTQTVRNRGSDYGHPSENHQLTADLWNAYLSRRLGREVRMSAEDVCMLNVLQKASRLADGTKDDSWLDIAGYTENVGMLRREQRNFRASDTPKI